MRRHALLGVLAAISCARPTTAWDYTCWDCVAFRASLWLPFSEALFYSTLIVVIILGLFLILQCWRWTRPEPAPLRAFSAAPPPEPEPVAPVAQAEIVPYPNR